MTMDIQIPNAEVTEWLDVLKPYQRSSLEKFLENASLEEAAQTWLGSTGSPNIIPFGGNTDTKPFWDRFQIEFRNFICDENAYVEDKMALQNKGLISKEYLINVVSTAIGASVGHNATLIAPAVTLLLCSVGKITKNAYCESG